MTHRRNGVYIASRTRHAERWRALRAEGHPITATWIDEAEPGETADWPGLWFRCVREAAESCLVVVYREPDEVLKGALVEVGAALAAGVPVYAVGDWDVAEHSWLHHPYVTGGASLECALKIGAEAARLAASFDKTPASAGDGS